MPEIEPDISTALFLDEQQKEFADIKDNWFEVFGFSHDCHCGDDFTAGRVGEITECYHDMAQEALFTCARLNAELKEVTAVAEALYAEFKERLRTEHESDTVKTVPSSENPNQDTSSVGKLGTDTVVEGSGQEDDGIGVQVFEDEGGATPES